MLQDHKELHKTCERYVKTIFDEEYGSDFLYHDLSHTQETVDKCVEISSEYDISDEDKGILFLSAWFHDTGYARDYKNHEEKSIEIAKKFMTEHQVLPKDQDRVFKLIRSTKYGHEPVDLLEEVLHDADKINIGRKRFFRKAEMLRFEWEKCLERVLSEEEWQQQQLEFLQNTHFRTAYCKNKYGKRKRKNLLEQSKSTSKIMRKAKKLGRGIETLYRAVYRNHINLSSIADNKANMMISINTIIVSVLVAGLGSGFSFGQDDFLVANRLVIPMALLMLGSLVSVVFAILAASPNVTDKDVNKKKIKKQKTSILFFGNFVNVELDKFIESLQMLREKQTMIYDNMSVDIYHLGHVLQRKYRLLRMSYLIFLSALSLCVVTFLILFFTM